MTSIEIVNKYLNIIFAEDNGGKGLSDILTEDFSFNDPFRTFSTAKEFIDSPQTQNWIKTKKELNMQKQFADGDSVCSIYIITVQTPLGKTASFELADHVEISSGKISKERVYFFDSMQFAKSMGFMDFYAGKYHQ